MTMRKVGVELEVSGLSVHSSHAAVRTIPGLRSVVADEWTSHRNRTYPAGTWKVMTDGTRGVSSETVSPPMVEAEHGDFRKVCEALSNAGAYIRRCCGGHIHIDAEDLTKNDIARLMGLWFASEAQMFKLVSKSRRRNRWCQRNVSALGREGNNPGQVAESLKRFASVADIFQHLCWGDRYYALNLDAYLGHNAVEFRLHQGTLNADKMLHFARLLSGMVDYAKTDQPMPATKFGTVDRMVEFFLPTAAPESGETTEAPAAITLPAEGTKARFAFDTFIEGEAQGHSTTEMYDRCEAHGMPRHSARRWMNKYRKATRSASFDWTGQDTEANAVAAAYLKARPAALV